MRGAMMAAVFSMQGIGFLAASITAVVVVTAFRSAIEAVRARWEAPPRRARRGLAQLGSRLCGAAACCMAAVAAPRRRSTAPLKIAPPRAPGDPQNLFTPKVVGDIGYSLPVKPGSTGEDLYHSVFGSVTGTAFIIMMGLVPGYFVTIGGYCTAWAGRDGAGHCNGWLPMARPGF